MSVACLPASAADMPVRMPVKAHVMAPVGYDWTGFYVGGNVGYSFGRSAYDWAFNDINTGTLFIAGVVLGYVTLPKALEVLIGFNPDGVTNLTDFNDYLQFFTRTLLVFGLAFNIPVFVVLLNLAGVVKGASLKAYRP